MKNKYFEKLIILSWIVFLFICLGLLSFTSHAESIYFPMNQNDNNKFTETDVNELNSLIDTENNYCFVKFTGTIISGSSRNKTCEVLVFPKNSSGTIFSEIFSNNYQFSLYSSGTVNTSCKLYQRDLNGSNHWSYIRTYDGNGLDSFQNLNSSLYDNTKCYLSNFVVYTSNNFQTRRIVLNYSDGSGDDPIVQGHATPPDPFEDPTLATGSNHTLPREVPESPTINNYTWITYNPPSIDTTNVESLLESLIYVINYLAGWLRDNLAGEFQNLKSNIKDLFQFIGNTIQYYGGLIISNIQNGIETFYNNMVSLFEPVVEKIDYLTEPVDGTIIYDNISSTSLVTNINTINLSLTAFQTSFTNLSEPSSFTIPIHLENLPSAYFGNQTTQYFDLGVIGSTEKGIIRTFMWALITYGLFITVVDSVSNYINGGGDES